MTEQASVAGFNEAPASLPGKRESSGKSGCCEGGFNEAPASLPGKLRRRAVGPRHRDSFNEAPASLPGKPVGVPPFNPSIQSASMRPRQVCRGNPRSGQHRRRARRASMRPRQVCRGNLCRRSPTSCRRSCFNEAPASLPGKRAGSSGAPCGRRHGFNEAPASLPGKPGAGSSARGGRSRFNEAPASLPGKRCFPRSAWTAAVASMRPRQVCRGNMSDALEGLIEVTLQ